MGATMLYDRATIEVRAGRGGDGCTSFRREARVPRGGPDGGDGGRGGDVVLHCDASLRDLQAFKRRAHFRAGRGGHGSGALRHGAEGETLDVGVPPGTVVSVEDGTRHDLVLPGTRVVVARGGPGGRGNKHFAGPTHQAPRFAERGLQGDEHTLELRLKLLADVGLVGRPNAGKSSLLARVTRARPKVAGYPFTTLEPVLGTAERDGRQLILADIPGLIEGASDGAGLGHEFLAHVERCRLLVHVLELDPLDGSDPAANFETTERELERYDSGLASLPRVLALSKADLVAGEVAEAAAQGWSQRLHDGAGVVVTSSATGQGLDALLTQVFSLAETVAAQPASGVYGHDPGAAARAAVDEPMAEHRVFRPRADRGFEITRADDGRWVVSGRGVERLVARYDPDNEEAMAFLERRLIGIGVISALEARGFRAGDDVEIGGVMFELDPGAPV